MTRSLFCFQKESDLLLRLCTSARPFGDDVFLCLGIGRECEGDPRKCCSLRGVLVLRPHQMDTNSYEVDANDQLRLAPSSALYLGGSIWRAHSLSRRGVYRSITALIVWWSHLRVISISGIYWWRVLRILLTWRHRTVGTTLRRIRVTRWSTQLIRGIVHIKTRIRGRLAGLRRNVIGTLNVGLRIVRGRGDAGVATTALSL